MIKKVLSNILIVVGIVCVAIALFIFWQEKQLEKNALNASQAALITIKDEMAKVENEAEEEKSDEILIDEKLYIGVLSLPTLGLELPIQNSWSYEKLKLTPCLYQAKPMVIAGHNYKVHFGRLPSLKIGDQVTLTLANGDIEKYSVSTIKTIDDTDVDAVENSPYDLMLLTCNYHDINERIIVGLTKTK